MSEHHANTRAACNLLKLNHCSVSLVGAVSRARQSHSAFAKIGHLQAG